MVEAQTIEVEAILSSLSPSAQKCVEAIKANPHNITNRHLIRLLGMERTSSVHNGPWSRVYQELCGIANRSEIIDSKDEPNRNLKGKILRKSSQDVWSYDPVL